MSNPRTKSDSTGTENQSILDRHQRIIWLPTNGLPVPITILPSSVKGRGKPRRWYRVGTTVYRSARQLLIAVGGWGKRNWTFDRFFKLGKWSKDDPHGLIPGRSTPITRVFILDGSMDQAGLDRTTLVPILGIDLEHRGAEVAKLLQAGFGAQIRALGLSFDDVLQEVSRGLVVRNAGKCPWDASKSSFGTYVHMVCSCVLSNYRKAHLRRVGREVVGLPDHLGTTDQVEMWEFYTYLSETGTSKEVLPLLLAGHSRAEIATILGLSRGAVLKTITQLRNQIPHGVKVED